MKKKYLRFIGLAVSIPFLLVFFSNFVIDYAADGKTYNEVNAIPKNRVGLILGTSKKIKGGAPNPYYTYRIDATVRLYKSGKIDFVLVSGDNGTIYYNEPTTIQKDLVKRGIPKNKIFLDYAGFRTLDSVIRAKEVFGLESVTIISQEFHNKRAVYLAEKKGMKAIGYNAKDVSGRQGFKVRFREHLARVKVFIDLTFNTGPKFYGEKIKIE
ncbi:vancomycin high temperature exclusion protein [Maribacter algicola]|uniref:Vancomycin high temperature exclusion protein n=1 Tax=Meishania litoralis TaxID=3434685 RepID=A0ACC7LLA1_9FLAO